MHILQSLRANTNFSAAEKEVAHYIIANPTTVIRMSIREIATKTYTSPTTVMRLCRKICNGGFAEFRILLAQEINELKHSEVIENKNQALSNHMIKLDEIMTQLNSNIINSIQLTQALINPEIVETVIKVILNSKTVDIYGRGASNNVGYDFYYKLFRIGINAHINTGVDLQYMQACNSNPEHCAVLISLTGETLEIVKIANILNHNGTPVITITGIQDSTLQKYSDFPLFIKCFETNQTVGAITSRSAMQYLLDVIYFIIFNADYEKNTMTLQNNYVPKNLLNEK